MNSFKLTAVGNLARNPEVGTTGEATFARFCLIGNDEVEEGEPVGPGHVATSLWFFAFGEIASTIARNAGKGDQLILEAKVIASQWTDQGGEKQLGHTMLLVVHALLSYQQSLAGILSAGQARRPVLRTSPRTSASSNPNARSQMRRLAG
jgi:single-strand DNA-binding protein